MKHRNGTKNRPIYLKIYEILRQEIVEGIYTYGQKIPSKRVLSEQYDVSLITIEHSLELLIEEGYLQPKERSGYLISYRADDIFAESMPSDLHNFREEILQEDDVPYPSLSQTLDRPAFPFGVYAKTMRKVISEQGEAILQRTPGTGLPALKTALCNYLARSRHMRIKPDQIVIGAGSEYLYGIIVQLLGRNRIYAIEQPSYAKIEQVYKANQASLELLPLGKDGIKSQALKRTSADVLHITPYRSYPSGISTSASKRREYILWASKNDRYIVEDDFESEFTPSTKPEETVFSLSTHDNVLYLNSFTQTIAPSLRISYLILPEKLIPEFQNKLGFYSCTVPCFEQFTLTEFINSGEFERHLNRVRRYNRTHNHES